MALDAERRVARHNEDNSELSEKLLRNDISTMLSNKVYHRRRKLNGGRALKKKTGGN